MSKIIELAKPQSAIGGIITSLVSRKDDIKTITVITEMKDGSVVLSCSSQCAKELTYHAAILQNEVQYTISTGYDSDA